MPALPDIALLAEINQHPVAFLVAALAVIGAYTIFTLVGFGSALLASGPLALSMPVGRVIPLLALLDFAGAALRGWRARRAVAWPEFARLLPGMLVGQMLGVFVLARLPAAPMAVALGLFIVWQGSRGLRQSVADSPNPAPGPAWRHGLFGGVLGGLFGSGGFIYAAYLERRLAERDAFRATQAVLIALSTAWRLALCLSAGLLDWQLLWTALLFAPAALLGAFLGHRIDLRLERRQLFRLLNGLLVACGVGLVLRFA